MVPPGCVFRDEVIALFTHRQHRVPQPWPQVVGFFWFTMVVCRRLGCQSFDLAGELRPRPSGKPSPGGPSVALILPGLLEVFGFTFVPRRTWHSCGSTPAMRSRRRVLGSQPEGPAGVRGTCASSRPLKPPRGLTGSLPSSRGVMRVLAVAGRPAKEGGHKSPPAPARRILLLTTWSGC